MICQLDNYLPPNSGAATHVRFKEQKEYMKVYKKRPVYQTYFQNIQVKFAYVICNANFQVA